MFKRLSSAVLREEFTASRAALRRVCTALLRDTDATLGTGHYWGCQGLYNGDHSLTSHGCEGDPRTPILRTRTQRYVLKRHGLKVDQHVSCTDLRVLPRIT